MSELGSSDQSTPQLIARYFARSVFLPSGLRYQRVLFPLIQALIVLGFGILVVLVCPPITQWVLQQEVFPGFEEYAKTHTEILNRWLTFSQTCFEFLTIVALGGSVFTERTKRMTQETLDRIQNALDSSSTSQLEDAQQGLQSRVAELLNTINATTWSNLAGTILRMALLSLNILQRLYSDVRGVNIPFLLVRFWISFPGGLYGFIALAAAFAVGVLKVVKTYVEVVGGAS